MPVIFQTQPGRVIRLDDSAVQCSVRLLGMQDSPILFEERKSIITRVTLSEQVNVQFLHALGAQVFIYVFGDRIGSISLAGLSFACDCIEDDIQGAEQMYLWYKDNRASRRQAPIRLMIGFTPIEGFVVGCREDVVDAATSMVQWNVDMVTLPDAVPTGTDFGGGGDFGGPGGGGGDFGGPGGGIIPTPITTPPSVMPTPAVLNSAPIPNALQSGVLLAS
jgi:hypothetical protein